MDFLIYQITGKQLEEMETQVILTLKLKATCRLSWAEFFIEPEMEDSYFIIYRPLELTDPQQGETTSS